MQANRMRVLEKNRNWTSCTFLDKEKINVGNIDDNTISFTFYEPSLKFTKITQPKDSTVADAIIASGEKLKNFTFKNYILFGKVLDLPGEVAIPSGILCGELKPESQIRAKRCKGAAPLPEKDGKATRVDDDEWEDEDKENKPHKEQLLFYLNSTNRGITEVANTAYEGKPLAVIANDGDTLKGACLKDGRFTKELFFYENDRTPIVEIPQQDEARSHARRLLNVKRMPAKKRKSDQAIDEESSEIANNLNLSERFTYSLMPHNVTDPFTEEIGKAMIQDARKSATKAFAKDGNENETDDSIKRMVGKFGKAASSALPARILEMLNEAKKSIGYLHCGDYGASCFLLAEDLRTHQKIIMTCQHVMNMINALRSEYGREQYGTIFIHFEYHDQHKLGNLVAEVDETRELIRGNLDYVLLFLKPNRDLERLPLLCFLLRRGLPRSGQVILMGHPDHQFKQFEVCQILPSHNCHATLCKRGSEEEENCINHEVDCIHMQKSSYKNHDFKNELPYDTSFFHGSSGSPVFNRNGHIVAMHAHGYPYKKNKKQYSLMEFGITCNAIYHDMKEQRGECFANVLFCGS